MPRPSVGKPDMIRSGLSVSYICTSFPFACATEKSAVHYPMFAEHGPIREGRLTHGHRNATHSSAIITAWPLSHRLGHFVIPFLHQQTVEEWALDCLFFPGTHASPGRPRSCSAVSDLGSDAAFALETLKSRFWVALATPKCFFIVPRFSCRLAGPSARTRTDREPA